MSCPSSTTHCHTFKPPVTSFKIMYFKVFNEPSIDLITSHLVLNYCSVAHNYSSCVVDRQWLCCQPRYLTGVGIVPYGGHSLVTCACLPILLYTLYFTVLIFWSGQLLITDVRCCPTISWLQHVLGNDASHLHHWKTENFNATETWNPLHFQPTNEE